MQRNMKIALSFAGLLGILVSLPFWAAGNHDLKAITAEETKARPTPEMDRLKFYLGDWDFTETYPKSNFFPGGGKNSGLYTSKLGPGGNSLINSFHSVGPIGDFEGLLIFTWDTKEKAYKAYVFGNDFPGSILETGQFEGDALVFRSELNVGGVTMKTRNVTRLTAPGQIESEEFATMKDLPETMLVHVDAKKR